MTTTLITGATGYIGRHLVARLVADGQRPRCLVRTSARLDLLPPGKVDIATGDITDPASLPAAMEGIESVVHAAAAVANIKQSATVNYKRINDDGTANMVKAARAAGVRHFIHVGGINTVPGAERSYIRTRYNGEQHV